MGRPTTGPEERGGGRRQGGGHGIGGGTTSSSRRRRSSGTSVTFHKPEHPNQLSPRPGVPLCSNPQCNDITSRQIRSTREHLRLGTFGPLPTQRFCRAASATVLRVSAFCVRVLGPSGRSEIAADAQARKEGAQRTLARLQDGLRDASWCIIVRREARNHEGKPQVRSVGEHVRRKG